MKIKKYKEIKLKEGDSLAIPCKRQNGKEDYFTVTIKDRIIYVNNRYMGASLEEVRSGVSSFSFIIQ